MKWMAIAAGVTLAQPALAQFTDGNTLYSRCENSESFCTGYIAGVVDTTGDPGSSFKTCLPVGVRLRQVIDVYLAYMKANPKDRHMPAYFHVVVAVQETWPCPKR